MEKRQTAGLVLSHEIQELGPPGSCSPGGVAWKRWRDSGQEQLETLFPSGLVSVEGRGRGTGRIGQQKETAWRDMPGVASCVGEGMVLKADSRGRQVRVA